MEKTLHNSDMSGARKNVPDIKVVGNGDMFPASRLLTTRITGASSFRLDDNHGWGRRNPPSPNNEVSGGRSKVNWGVLLALRIEGRTT